MAFANWIQAYIHFNTSCIIGFFSIEYISLKFEQFDLIILNLYMQMHCVKHFCGYMLIRTC